MDLIVCLANRIYAIVKIQRKLIFAGMLVMNSPRKVTGNSQPRMPVSNLTDITQHKIIDTK